MVSSKPLMALRLHHLLTPWGGDALTAQQILGRATQPLYDNAILAGTELLGGLWGSVDILKITLILLSLENRSHVWYAIQKPYWLPVTYEIRAVSLDAIVEPGIADYPEFLGDDPNAVLAVRGDDGSRALWQLRPRRAALGPLAPSTSEAAIRSVVRI